MQTTQEDASAPFARTSGFTRYPPATYRIADRAITSQAPFPHRFVDTGKASELVNSRAKHAFDVVAAMLGLLLLLPGLLATAIAIKVTSPGPILFRQRRYGLNNNLFVVYKFRTMYIDKGDETGTKQTCSSDERVTPIGKILRRYSIDELPQLLNIVKGDMSLVGPRPHVPGMLAGGMPYEALVPYYFERHRVRPGLTGLAQAQCLRGSTVDPERALARVNEDLRYIQNWSFGLDLRIIFATLWIEFYNWGNGT